MSSASNLFIDARTTQQVELASSPRHSAWVSANAGAGKTFVLSRRVVRLLLQGSDPSRLLCLTFTKAAAGEMSNRVFEMLGEWAVADDKSLHEMLTKVEGRAPTDQQMSRARTLFARALETPGGLKIQTIHAFCEALLHQFPLEANVPGSFDVMDDAQQQQLIEEARRQTIIAARKKPGGDLGRAFADLLDAATDNAIEKALDQVVSDRDKLTDWLDGNNGVQQAMQVALQRFGFSSNDTAVGLETSAADASLLTPAEWQRLSKEAQATGQSSMIGLAQAIERMLDTQDGSTRFGVLQDILFLKSGAKRSFGKYPTKAVEEAIPGIRDLLSEEADRVADEQQRIATFRLIEKTEPLLIFAQAMLERYRRAKRRRGLLDFDDLVARTADLLSRSDARSWVLYKLDLGIDHILLDEAQDTSPRQWQVISALVDEFFAGEGARSEQRTVFAVGDEKQSIYSFQGAEPALFDKHRASFQESATKAQQGFEQARLALSFRSTGDVLGAVDTVFAVEENAQGLTFGDDYQRHTAARRNDPGTVEVWPYEMAQPHEEPESWAAPPDLIGVPHQAVRLAETIADDIREQIHGGRHKASGKPVLAGDIIVLVRSRDLFVTALTRALKERDIPVAGADRLAITDHIAVLDLMALGTVMVTPEDDLSLAALLKSPLFGIGEDELLRLARHRFSADYEKSLFEALEDLREDVAFASAFERLAGWRKRADAMPVYEFYAGILGADGGRLQFYQRLGQEAEDVLDAFLDIALSHERDGLPGLQAFLEALEAGQPEIKREFDAASGEVRVMTVHAAKGLEAPIVYLADKGSAAFQGSHAPALYRWGDDEDEPQSDHGWLWVPASAEHGDATTPLLEDEKRRGEEEYRRLLYVAMTRARDKLVVCGYCGKNGPPKEGPNWLRMVAEALGASWIADEENPEPGRFVWTAPDTPQADPDHHEDEAPRQPHSAEPVPAYIRHQLPAEKALPRPLNPSGAQALIEESLAEAQVASSLLDGTAGDGFGSAARRRGTAVHLLLQVLPDIPREERTARAAAWLEQALPDFSQDARQTLIASVESILDHPDLAPVFDPVTSRAEVPVMGCIDLASGPRPVSGTIDRLAVLEDRVVLIDFKTSATVPDDLAQVPQDYVTQMALYRSLVARLYSDRALEAWLVWTHAGEGPTMMKLPDISMDEALFRITGL